jgi:hypothetical protein
MSDCDAFAHEIAALLIADIKTSGARTHAELEEACRLSLKSLLGDAAVPDQIAVLMPLGLDRWPRVVVRSDAFARPGRRSAPHPRPAADRADRVRARVGGGRRGLIPLQVHPEHVVPGGLFLLQGADLAARLQGPVGGVRIVLLHLGCRGIGDGGRQAEAGDEEEAHDGLSR